MKKRIFLVVIIIIITMGNIILFKNFYNKVENNTKIINVKLQNIGGKENGE